MFVEDDHALTEPSTMVLTAKALADFFDLGGERSREGMGGTVAAGEAPTNETDQGTSQRNVEVTVVLCFSASLTPHSNLYFEDVDNSLRLSIGLDSGCRRVEKAGGQVG